jgi:hypothetical protein
MYLRLIFFTLFAFCYFTGSSQQKGNIPDDSVFVDAQFSMPKEEALELMKSYKTKRWKRHKRFGPVGRKYDAGSCWFDISKFNKFTMYINDRLEKSGNEGVVSGFRFYYITYGKKKKGDHVPDELAKLGSTKKIHSLLIVATQKKDGVQTDIIIGNKVAAFIAKIENEGTLCPPLPPEKCSGATLANEVYEP